MHDTGSRKNHECDRDSKREREKERECNMTRTRSSIAIRRQNRKEFCDWRGYKIADWGSQKTEKMRGKIWEKGRIKRELRASFFLELAAKARGFWEPVKDWGGHLIFLEENRYIIVVEKHVDKSLIKCPWSLLLVFLNLLVGNFRVGESTWYCNFYSHSGFYYYLPYDYSHKGFYVNLCLFWFVLTWLFFIFCLDQCCGFSR